MSLPTISPVDFENLRIALMNSYNTEALTHAGYIVAIIIGICTLFSSDAFLDLYRSRKRIKKIVFYGILSLSLSLMFYFAFRLIVWSWLGSQVLVITMDNATARQMPTLISGLQNSTLNDFSRLHPLGFTYTSHGLTDLGLFLTFALPLLISFGLCWIIGEKMFRTKEPAPTNTEKQVKEIQGKKLPQKKR